MKQVTLFTVLLLSLYSCSSSKKLNQSSTATVANAVQTDDTDGLSYEKAIMIDAKGELDGVDKEYVWLRQHYPGYKLRSQALTNYQKKPYDVMRITTSEGRDKTIYFDISNFFGKF